MLFPVDVFLGELDPGAVRVELFAEGQECGEPFRQPMERSWQIPSRTTRGYMYMTPTPATRPADHFTPWVWPYHTKVALLLEANQILWQK